MDGWDPINNGINHLSTRTNSYSPGYLQSSWPWKSHMSKSDAAVETWDVNVNPGSTKPKGCWFYCSTICGVSDSHYLWSIPLVLTPWSIPPCLTFSIILHHSPLPRWIFDGGTALPAVKTCIVPNMIWTNGSNKKYVGTPNIDGLFHGNSPLQMCFFCSVPPWKPASAITVMVNRGQASSNQGIAGRTNSLSCLDIGHTPKKWCKMIPKRFVGGFTVLYSIIVYYWVRHMNLGFTNPRTWLDIFDE